MKLMSKDKMNKKTITFILCIFLFFAYTPNSLSEASEKYSYNSIDAYKTPFLQSNEETLIILDYSNSMNARIGYTSKLIMAIDALRSVLNNAPADTKIGLRILGFSNSSYSSTNNLSLYEQEICSATKLVVPIGQNTKENILNSFNSYASRGASPIGLALREAIQNDFSSYSSSKHIVLITDGADTCGDNPCLFLANLLRTRNDIRIDVIGITVKENEYSSLQCLAASGKGAFYEIKNPNDFNHVFNALFKFSPQRQIYRTPQAQNIQNVRKPQISYKNYLFEFKN